MPNPSSRLARTLAAQHGSSHVVSPHLGAEAASESVLGAIDPNTEPASGMRPFTEFLGDTAMSSEVDTDPRDI